jgi:hypothetical protein
MRANSHGSIWCDGEACLLEQFENRERLEITLEMLLDHAIEESVDAILCRELVSKLFIENELGTPGGKELDHERCRSTCDSARRPSMNSGLDSPQ